MTVFCVNVIRSGADKLPSDSLSGLITRTLHCHLCRKVKLWCNRVTFQTTTLLPPRKRSLGQGNGFTSVWDSVHRRGCLPYCMLGYPLPPAPEADTLPTRGRHPLDRPPRVLRDTVNNGWYASYWTAFLHFLFKSDKNTKISSNLMLNRTDKITQLTSWTKLILKFVKVT